MTIMKKITFDQIEAARALLSALSVKKKSQFSKKEAVAELESDIRNAMDVLGYSSHELAQELKKAGFDISPSSLQSNMRELEADKAVGGAPRDKPKRKAAKSTVAKADPLKSDED